MIHLIKTDVFFVVRLIEPLLKIDLRLELNYSILYTSIISSMHNISWKTTWFVILRSYKLQNVSRKLYYWVTKFTCMISNCVYEIVYHHFWPIQLIPTIFTPFFFQMCFLGIYNVYIATNKFRVRTYIHGHLCIAEKSIYEIVLLPKYTVTSWYWYCFQSPSFMWFTIRRYINNFVRILFGKCFNILD